MEIPTLPDNKREQILADKHCRDIVLEIHQYWLQSEGQTREQIHAAMCSGKGGLILELATLAIVKEAMVLDDTQWRYLCLQCTAKERESTLHFYGGDEDDSELFQPLII